jgi:hypothetical protein
MKKYLFILAILLFGATVFAQNKSITIPEGSLLVKGATFSDVNFNASDTINESETYWIEFTCKKDYPQMQDVYIDIDSVSGAPNVTMTLKGKKFSGDTYATIGTPVVWYGTTDTTFTYTNSIANRYRFYRLEFVADATDQQSLITDVRFKTWYTGGQFSSTSITDGTATLTGGALSGVTTIDASGAVTLNSTVALGDATTDVTTINGSITSDQTLAAGASQFYLRSTLTGTSGDHNNVRVRGQSAAVGASTSDVRGLYAQGVTNEGLYGGAVTSIYANSIAKGTSTTTTLRGILIDTETEGTPTALTNMYGLYIRNKSTIAVATDNYSMVIDNEKMGTGIVQDAGIQLKTTTWGSGVTAWTYGIDMNQTGAFGTADIRFQNGETISNGTDGVIDVGAANVQSATYNFADATAVAGTADAITIDFTADLTVTSGTMITFIAEAANTGAATLDVDSAGALAINKYNGAKGAISANDIRSGQVVTVVYDGSVWVIMSPIGN